MSIIIDPSVVDIDLGEEAKRLGFVPGQLEGELFSSQPFYEDVVNVIPEAEWRPLSELAKQAGGNASLIQWILNQLREGSCVGNAFTQGVQFLITKVFGPAASIELSAISAYKQIGRSPNSGAMVGDGMEAVMNVGVLPLDTPANRMRFKHVMPATGFYTPWPDGWKETAKLFRAIECHVVRSVAGLVTALLNGHPVVVGRSGHSILYLDIIFDGANMFALYVNSWGKWGIAAGNLAHGFGLDSIRMIRSSAGYAVAMRAPTKPDFLTSPSLVTAL